jgi:multidrug efflux pump subunit AcrB
MNLSEIFIRRPVMTVLVMLAILLFGMMSYTLLPISALPSVEYPFIQVSASLPGATPEVMAASVAAPLERQFTEIAGLNSNLTLAAESMRRLKMSRLPSLGRLDNCQRECPSPRLIAR